VLYKGVSERCDASGKTLRAIAAQEREIYKSIFKDKCKPGCEVKVIVEVADLGPCAVTLNGDIAEGRWMKISIFAFCRKRFY
ncbi:MAG: hypothetical protein U0166_25990, partial [Acidobacteriota bacterium]